MFLSVLYCIAYLGVMGLVPAIENKLIINYHVRPPGFCHCWSVRLEQSTGPCPHLLQRSCFQAPTKTFLFA